MMRSALYLTNTPSWMFIVLGHWNKIMRVDMSIHSDTLFWFWANQSLLFLLNAACLQLSEEATNTIFLVFGLTLPGLEPTTLTITPPMRCLQNKFPFTWNHHLCYLSLLVPVLSNTYYVMFMSSLSSSCLRIVLSWLTLPFSLTFILNVLCYIVLLYPTLLRVQIYPIKTVY